MQLGIKILSLQQQEAGSKKEDDKSAKDDARSKKDDSKFKNKSQEKVSAPQPSDIQRVQTYFTNISLIGSYDHRTEASASDKNTEDSKQLAQKPMTYVEKVNHETFVINGFCSMTDRPTDQVIYQIHNVTENLHKK